ncbi:sugar ABC transporter permease [Candidatus Poribacteria bacterium]|nr:MAG: sugar ABC transporter permease [Candidatus Poribacteria bacterium]
MDSAPTQIGVIPDIMKRLNLRMYAMVFALVCVWVIFTLLTGGTFLSTRNLSNLSRQAAVTAILAVGMTLVIVSANIDLSVGYGAGLLGAIAAIVHVWWGQPILLTLFIVICIGILMGLMQGYLVAYQRIPAFIVTLGGFLAYRGLMLAFTKGETILLPDNWLKAIGNAYLSPTLGWGLMLIGIGISGFRFYRQRLGQLQYGNSEQASLLMFLLKVIGVSALIIAFIAVMNTHKGVPFPVCILFGLAFVFHFIANHTRFGRYVYAVGGNAEAAYLSGVNVRSITLRVFATMGALMAIAGVVMTARVGSASPEAGRLLELDAIAACVIGGASLMGGRGSIFGAILGAFVMESLNNGMSMANMDASWQDIIKGVVLVAAVGFDIASRRR